MRARLHQVNIVVSDMEAMTERAGGVGPVSC
jgi:hypothetical protein